MGAPREFAENYYPEQQFDTDFDIYLRLAQDVVAASVTIEVLPEYTENDDPWNNSRAIVYRSALEKQAQELVEQSIPAAIASAAYTIAYTSHLADAKEGNRQKFFAMAYEFMERADPLPEHKPTPVFAADRQADNFVFSDALRRKPRFTEGKHIASWVKVEYTPSDRTIARYVDEFETRRSRKNATNQLIQ